jgi:hypothetical protein
VEGREFVAECIAVGVVRRWDLCVFGLKVR